jgi:hypothetical protein
MSVAAREFALEPILTYKRARAAKTVPLRYNAQLKQPTQNYAQHHVLRGLQLCQPTFTYARFP